MKRASSVLIVLTSLGTVHCAGEDPSAPGSGTGATGAGAWPGATGGVAGGGATGGGATGGLPGSGGGQGATGGSGGPTAGSGGSAGGGATAGSGSGASGGGGGAAGSGATGGDETGGGGGAPPEDGVYTAPGFQNLAPPLGAPLDEAGTPLNPPAPEGWTYHEIDGAKCRDGSPAGFYVRRGTTDKLMWYLEGGGACDTPGFCVYNPANVNQVLAGNGQTVAGSIGGAVTGRQQPGKDGIFDITNAANPFKDWSQIYTPYCTGDVYFGTKENATVPGLAQPQQFVGYRNMQKFVARIVPTFSDVSRVIITGASAGGFGAALNFSMIQDAFQHARVDILDDSGPPMEDQYMFACMQKRWRALWGFEGSLPPDCTECQQEDGGGLVHLADFALRKHPHATLAAISSAQDEIIRLFFSAGLKDCAAFETADPVMITIGQLDPNTYMPGQLYSDGLKGVRTLFHDTGRLATYFITDPMTLTFHQHIWRPEFYTAAAGGVTEAAWVQQFLDGEITDVGN